MADNDQAQSAFDESDLVSLGEKLASLDLTDPERAALGALINDDDVGGFGRFGGGFDIIGGIRKGIGIRVPGGFGVRGPSGSPGVRADGIRGPSSDPNVHGIRKPGRM